MCEFGELPPNPNINPLRESGSDLSKPVIPVNERWDHRTVAYFCGWCGNFHLDCHCDESTGCIHCMLMTTREEFDDHVRDVKQRSKKRIDE